MPEQTGQAHPCALRTWHSALRTSNAERRTSHFPLRIRPNVNVTPLIDVLLVLLIIFMVVVPLRPHEIETRPPVASAGSIPPGQAIGPVLVRMDLNREIFLNGRPSALFSLAANLAEVLGRRPDSLRDVLISAPKELDYRSVVQIIDIAKGAGAGDIGLVAQ